MNRASASTGMELASLRGGVAFTSSRIRSSTILCNSCCTTAPLYDPLVKLLGIDSVRGLLLKQAAVLARDRVLDIGCGTGTMAILIKRLHPDTDVIGLDPDPRALARARHKAERARLSILFDQGFSDRLPYPDASFDRVFSSFMFQHLRADDRATTLSEVWRVLKPGGLRPTLFP
jgi:ubiquinone/menaquinone biosynthesis C-methylase UbiE